MEKIPKEIQRFAESLGGKIEECEGPLPDGSGFAVMSMPLPKDHWIYQGDEFGYSGEPPAPFRMGIGPLRDAISEAIREAGRYAVKASTMCGKEMDFDPDAMLQNMIVGLLGYWTEDGHSHLDEMEEPDGNQTK